ncbi:MAG: hypothetical protein LBJ08_11540, partial [Bifidobacteriaceae bacterium]|nr:hypothetical protein [Bifidobacteriaceae bacterium]
KRGLGGGPRGERGSRHEHAAHNTESGFRAASTPSFATQTPNSTVSQPARPQANPANPTSTL